MGQVNNSGSNASFWTDLGLPPPKSGTSESQAIANIRALGDEFAIDGLSKAEADVLKSVANLSISDPTLPRADKEKLTNFLTNLDRAMATMNATGKPPSSSEPAGKILNDWCAVSAVVDLFKSTSEIAMLLSKMAREDSKLKQALGGLLLEMAKEAKNLAIAAGEARAQQYEADARKAWIEFGCAIGQMAIVIASTIGTHLREKQYKSEFEGVGKDNKPHMYKDLSDTSKSLKAREFALQDMQPFQQFANALTTAMKSGAEAIIDQQKADLERVASKSEGIKQLIDKIFQMIQETYSTMTDDMKELRAAMDKFIQTLENAQRTSTEQWKA